MKVKRYATFTTEHRGQKLHRTVSYGWVMATLFFFIFLATTVGFLAGLQVSKP